MKVMFLSDFLMLKRGLWKQGIINLIVGLVVVLVTNNLYVMPVMVGMTTMMFLIFTTLSLDERNNWQQFRLALPLSRSSVIYGRYLSVFLFTIGSLSIGVLGVLLVRVVFLFLPNISILSCLMVNFSWTAVFATCGITMVIAFLMLSLVMPLIMALGIAKAARFASLIFLVCILAPSLAASKLAPTSIFDNFFSWLETMQGFLIISSIIFILIVSIYIISACISLKLYAKREF